MIHTDTIVALATASGSGAIAIIRLSGDDAIPIADKQFKSVSDKKLIDQKSHTIHLGHIVDDQRTLDEVLVSVFKTPHSYTGQNVIEISCHGSPYIQQEIIQLLIRGGARMANPGEFTLRAFLNGKLDLSQAEAVADLIASENEASHQVAMQQMRGGFSSEIAKLRSELMDFASLIELELDFAEEDVEFANRDEFKRLVDRIILVLKRLIDSFAVGNVIKNGIPVAIIGEPNVGKSTLLNAFLNEERAIVSDIAGTTRDTIEDEIAIGGIGFRFIDTAGIRKTDDVVESIGIKKTFEKMEQAQVVLYLIEAQDLLINSEKIVFEIRQIQNQYPQKPILVIINKIDKVSSNLDKEIAVIPTNTNIDGTFKISAKNSIGIEQLSQALLNLVKTGALKNNETIVTNTRHYDALLKSLEEMQKVKMGIDTNLPGDLMAIDIRQALFHLGEITGEITTDDLLGNIFANFCIGK